MAKSIRVSLLALVFLGAMAVAALATEHVTAAIYDLPEQIITISTSENNRFRLELNLSPDVTMLEHMPSIWDDGLEIYHVRESVDWVKAEDKNAIPQRVEVYLHLVSGEISQFQLNLFDLMGRLTAVVAINWPPDYGKFMPRKGMESEFAIEQK